MPCSMYDGLKEDWGYPEADRSAARRRLARIKGRASFVCSEQGPPYSVEATRSLIEGMGFSFPCSYVPIPYRNHTDTWTLRDIPERRCLREWLMRVLRDRPGLRSLRGRVCGPNSAGVPEVRIESGSHWALTDPEGYYVLPGLVEGNRRVTAVKEGYRFLPDGVSVTLPGENLGDILFQAVPLQGAP